MRANEMLSCVEKPQLSIYIHIPFCVRKCFYCDFLSGPANEEEIEAYVSALIQEIEIQSKEYVEYCVPTIFIGGGTPSLLSALQIERIVKALQANFSLEKNMEFTIEVNPGTVNKQKLELYKKIGINRLSIGLQSAQNEELKAIGRIHTYETFLETYELARKIGFTNINIDLMSALPGQDEKTYESTVRKICELHPEHISSYSLIIEEETEFFNRYGEKEGNKPCNHERNVALSTGQEDILEYPALPNEDTERHMYEMTEWILKEYGYHRYEISNYCQQDKECKHNLVYWQRGNYLGLGIGAASLVENVRFTNARDRKEYVAGCGKIKDKAVLSQREQMEEFMFLGLRVIEGVSVEQFHQCFQMEIKEIFGENLERLQQEKLIEIDERRGLIHLTPYGIDISNYVLAHFLLDN